MNSLELIEIIGRGEDSKHQFKKDINNAVSLAGEMIAFSNAKGGMIIIGVEDNGEPIGLTQEDISRLNQLISNAASNNVKNPINPITENINIGDKTLIVVHIAEGGDKPYMDNTGVTWIKSGSDKRRVTSREELRRLFQNSDLVHADEVPVTGTTENDIDIEYFKNFYQENYEESIEFAGLPLIHLLNNLNLAVESKLNIAGLLLFGKEPAIYKSAFIIKAVRFIGNDATGDKYSDSVDIKGKLKIQFEGAIDFIKRNLKYPQQDKGINSLGELEIPLIVFEELVVNAIIHRDYFINAPIRIFVFDNRIEIISPGKLPNNLTIENIKSGNSNIRNDILTSFATKVLPYRGIGTGIRRAIKNYPNIEFENNRDGETFTVIIKRRDDL
ncbi:MAG: putative DNA binding domain-containing protein [Bacteroidetes bacterium]|nr:putative DNA binding domain-containing protein [Bacteroidota bacterium]MBU1114129.1 putative DNA binding domain-containing protein [Bacteroidota bacterium]MBU1800545.1 putative DNA binding domain-containing protein [Bacteroidota bacterium]